MIATVVLLIIVNIILIAHLVRLKKLIAKERCVILFSSENLPKLKQWEYTHIEQPYNFTGIIPNEKAINEDTFKGKFSLTGLYIEIETS